MPSTLLQKMMETEKRTKNGATAIDATGEFSTDEAADLMRFQAMLVKKACVVPRIVDNPAAPEEIRFEDIDDDDYLFLVKWCGAGSVEGENFEQFRQQS